MSYREFDFIFVRQLCDVWLEWNEKRYQKKLKQYNELPFYSKWIELEPVYSNSEYWKVKSLQQLATADGGLNRIVYLSAEDCRILHQPFQPQNE